MIFSLTPNLDLPVDNSLGQLASIKEPIHKSYYQPYPHSYFIYSQAWHEYNHSNLFVPSISISNNTTIVNIFDEVYDIDIYNTFIKIPPKNRVKIKAKVKSVQYKKAPILPIDDYLL